MRKNFLKWENKGVFTLRELSEKEVKTLNHKSTNQSYWGADEFLLNCNYDIKDGVLYLKGSMHKDKLLCKDSRYGIEDLVFKHGSEKYKELIEKYNIGTKNRGPFKKKKFNLRKFKRVMTFNKSKVYICGGRYIPKKGIPYTYKTSNFRIIE